MQINKRVFQLTGQRVHDHKLGPTASMAIFLQHLRKAPKPRTLAQELEEQKPEIQARLAALPNLKMHKKRQTRGDKDKAVGRFKLIEEEFRRRDLPEQGHGWVTKGREIENLRGGA